MLDFEGYPLWLNLVVFAAGAAAIWLSGTRLARYAEAISDRTGVGKVFIGALLLGGITSLPEGATTVTASATGSAELAVNNLFGGVALQIVILALADAIVPGRALTARVRDPSVLLEGSLLALVLATAATAIALGDRPVLGVGVGSAVVFGAAIAGFFLTHQHRRRETWEPEAEPAGQGEGEDDGDGEEDAAEGESTARLVVYTTLAGAAILVAGYAVARSADVLAEQTGLGASFVGMILLAAATSLPEVSTTVAAIRAGQVEMGFSNIFGANLLDLAILFVADLAFAGGPVLGVVGDFSLIAALLGILVTGVYIVGMLERRKRVLLGLGLDSIAVAAIYAFGVAILYTMR